MSTLYLTEQHSYVHRDHEALVVRLADRSKVSVPATDVDQVVVLGDVTLSAAAVEMVLAAGAEICYCTAQGRFRGRLAGDWRKTSLLRIEQHRVHQDEEQSLQLARRFVRGKLLNMRVLVQRAHRRLGDEELALAAERLGSAAERAMQVASLTELLGTEGSGSAAYFAVLGRLILPPFEFSERNRRPPRDPVNAMLSFGYTVLINALQSAVSVVGMDPYIGFLHSAQYGKPALALDLAEEFRAVIVDSTVLTVTNNRMLRPEDFEDTGSGIWMRPQGRKRFLGVLEERLGTEVEHPVLNIKTTYRRCLELQARQVARWLRGEVEEYMPFRVR